MVGPSSTSLFELALLALAWGLAARLRPAPRAFARAAVAWLTARVVLLGDPLAWVAWDRLLETEHVGYRQNDTLALERSRRAPGPPVRVLAVGSSQVPPLWGQVTDVATLSGMSPVDLVVWRDAVRARRPEVVALTLSAYDLAKAPRWTAVPLAPPLGARAVTVAADLLATGDPNARPAARDLLVGELLPEYRWRFLFRGLRDRALGLPSEAAALRADRPFAADAGPDAWRAALRGPVEPAWIPRNAAWVARFVEQVDARVVIFEGAVYPGSYDAALEGAVRRELAGIPGAEFVPRADLPPLEAGDFRDAVHVWPEAGRRWGEAALRRL